MPESKQCFGNATQCRFLKHDTAHQIATTYGNLIEVYKTVMSNFREWWNGGLSSNKTINPTGEAMFCNWLLKCAQQRENENENERTFYTKYSYFYWNLMVQ